MKTEKEKINETVDLLVDLMQKNEIHPLIMADSIRAMLCMIYTLFGVNPDHFKSILNKIEDQYKQYQGITISGAAASTYTIGQMPLLQEDFHDLLVYRPLMIYFSSISPDKAKAAMFKEMYTEGERRLAEYSGSNTIDVNLGRNPQFMNPNLFCQDIGGTP